MPRITREMLKKRAEHNESIITTLEEISLHQEEIEKIERIGTYCRKLKIIYLQNNIISKIEDLTHMKELEYLNLALNNIAKIEGLEGCEFLNKLDLTVNFIDFDTVKESIEHLQSRRHLRDLYLVGNPVQANWDGLNDYVIAKLPQLKYLDGNEITPSKRILAQQRLAELEAEVARRAVVVAAKKRAEAAEAKKLEEEEDMTEEEESLEDGVVEVKEGEVTDISGVTVTDVAEKKTKKKKKKKLADDEASPYTPESRTEMYLELAEQKAEKEARAKEMQPRDRDYAQEHKESVEKARKAEAEGIIRQTNQGKWDYKIEWEENSKDVVIDVGVPRYLDSSLMDLDVHPTYFSLVIKGKLLRLTLPEEVKASEGTAHRSKITGRLRITLPKLNPREDLVGLATRTRARMRQEAADKEAEANQESKKGKGRDYMREEMLSAAAGAGGGAGRTGGGSKAVSVEGIVRKSPEDEDDSVENGMSGVGGGSSTKTSGGGFMTELSTVRAGESHDLPAPKEGVVDAGDAPFVDDSDVPPLI